MPVTEVRTKLVEECVVVYEGRSVVVRVAERIDGFGYDVYLAECRNHPDGGFTEDEDNTCAATRFVHQSTALGYGLTEAVELIRRRNVEALRDAPLSAEVES